MSTSTGFRVGSCVMDIMGSSLGITKNDSTLWAFVVQTHVHLSTYNSWAFNFLVGKDEFAVNNKRLFNKNQIGIISEFKMIIEQDHL